MAALESRPPNSPTSEAGWRVLAMVASALAMILAVQGPGQRLLARARMSSGDVAAQEPGSLADAVAIPALRGIPDVRVSYYDIEATDAAGIKSELRSSGILWGEDRYRALTTYDYRWRWDAAPGGGCGTAGAKVKFRAWVTLPRHANPEALSPAVARAWRSYIDALIRHEANHVRIAYDGRLAVADAVRSSGCGSANAAGELAIAQVNYESAQYDERTHHGWKEGARFRVPTT